MHEIVVTIRCDVEKSLHKIVIQMSPALSIVYSVMPTFDFIRTYRCLWRAKSRQILLFWPNVETWGLPYPAAGSDQGQIWQAKVDRWEYVRPLRLPLTQSHRLLQSSENERSQSLVQLHGTHYRDLDCMSLYWPRELWVRTPLVWAGVYVLIHLNVSVLILLHSWLVVKVRQPFDLGFWWWL